MTSYRVVITWLLPAPITVSCHSTSHSVTRLTEYVYLGLRVYRVHHDLCTRHVSCVVWRVHNELIVWRVHKDSTSQLMCAHVMCHVWYDVCTMTWLSDVYTMTHVTWLVHDSSAEGVLWHDSSMTHVTWLVHEHHLRKVFCDMTRQWRMWRDLSMTHSALWCDLSMSLETPSAESVLWHDSSMTLPTWLFDNSWCAVIWLINVSRNTIYRKCSLTWLTGRDLSMTHQCL